MPNQFYIADTHFGHGNIIRYDNRPFFNVDDMERDMVANWNQAVTDSDIVYILGDFCWGKEAEWVRILSMLHGHKVLIRGNHDLTPSGKLRPFFQSVHDYAEIKDNGRHVVLCHYPMPCFKNHYRGWFHLYGHVHTGFEANMMESDKASMTALYDTPCNMFNVGCMMPYMNYTPRTLDEILTGAGSP